MYHLSDGDNTYLVSDDLRLIFEIAARNSFDHILYVTNTTNGNEVMLQNGIVVASNNPGHHTHGGPNTPSNCTILNCGN